MKIPFVTRSRFLEPVEDQVVSACRRGAGWPLQVRLDQGGYPGQIEITLDPYDPDKFEANWERSDPTRFPQRIRAAATWLRDHAHFGRFTISHDDGVLTIAREWSE